MISSFCQDIYQMLCKKFPNRKIYVISDQHFFHKNIIDYTRQNFSNVTEMNQYIITKHNEIVEPDDIVILLGDFCFKHNFIKETLEKMNGHKYLILGNHDSANLVKSYPNLGFESVFTTPIKINDDYFSHEPLIEGEKNDSHFQLVLNEFKKCSNGTNYHGHIHNKEDFSLENYKNVTCEALDYKPTLIGQTKDYNQEENRPLFINSPYFDQVLTNLSKEHGINPFIIISDYIYSYLLENLSSYQRQYFVQGSYGLLKKFNFISKISDIDITFIYNTLISKGNNISLLKKMVDEAYESIKQIEQINLQFLKRYSNLRIFDILYTSKQANFAHCVLDSNLIFLDCYKDTDFFKLEDTTIIQKFLDKSSSLQTEYQFPKFQAQFLIPEGDIANLLLQLLFQQGYDEKKILILKKLQYVYERNFKNRHMENFSDIFVRFFLRNIYFLYTMRRYDEIEFIQNHLSFSPSLFSSLPSLLQCQIHDLLNNYSKFLAVYDEISSIPISETQTKCFEITRKLKIDQY